MSESKFEKADRLFTPTGLWRQIVPAIAFNGVAIFVLAIAMASRAGEMRWPGLAISLGLGASVCLFNLFRYSTAKSRHDDLKLRFADGYRALVDEGKVVLNLTSILYMGQPKGVRWKYFNEGNPWD